MILEDPVIGPQTQIDKETVKSAFSKMKKSKTSGKFGIVIDMLLALGDSGLERITSLFNCIL